MFFSTFHFPLCSFPLGTDVGISLRISALRFLPVLEEVVVVVTVVVVSSVVVVAFVVVVTLLVVICSDVFVE